MAEPKPFHEALVDTLGEIEKQHWARDALRTLGMLTERSVIPKDHDKIASAFRRCEDKFRWNDNVFADLFAHLEREKVRHEKKAAEKAAATKSVE